MASDIHSGFACDLLKALPRGSDPNTVCSPWSLSSALSVLSAGVDDDARREILSALAARDGLEDAIAALARDAAGLTGEAPGDDSVLAVVNTLWVDEHCSAAVAFEASLARWPGASLGCVPMARDPRSARLEINRDVAETTRDLIPEILPERAITRDERAVLINALYLLAGWLDRFADTQTTDELFHCPGGSRTLATMRGAPQAPYAASAGWQYVALPLALGLRAEVLLPPGPMTDPRPELDSVRLAALRAAASPHRVELHLPRFRVESAWSVVEALQLLGIDRIFDENALAVVGVVTNEPLYISSAYHAAVLHVDERGVEGAAATAITARRLSAVLLPSVEMRVDRPFLFLVTHRKTAAVIFLARIASP